MGKFVPVVDEEAPKAERDDNSAAQQKHRKFDRSSSSRGWEQGTVGWGVQGSFGSASKDLCAQVASAGSGNFKMVMRIVIA